MEAAVTFLPVVGQWLSSCPRQVGVELEVGWVKRSKKALGCKGNRRPKQGKGNKGAYRRKGKNSTRKKQ